MSTNLLMECIHSVYYCCLRGIMEVIIYLYNFSYPSKQTIFDDTSLIHLVMSFLIIQPTMGNRQSLIQSGNCSLQTAGRCGTSVVSNYSVVFLTTQSPSQAASSTRLYCEGSGQMCVLELTCMLCHTFRFLQYSLPGYTFLFLTHSNYYYFLEILSLSINVIFIGK